MIKTVIVDDEEPARLRIRNLLRSAEDIEIAAECRNGYEALESISALNPALLFLDIQMPQLDGFGVLKALGSQKRPDSIVFVTAYDRYAVQAFEVSAIDYLLKPYSADRFGQALNRVRARLGSGVREDDRIDRLMRALEERQPKHERLVLRSRDGVQFVEIEEIDWLQGDGNYTLLHLGESELRIRESISELEERLRPHGFMRVHRSIIVNAERIFRIEPWGSGEYVLFLRNGAKIQSSRKYSEQLQGLFK